jgi:hypothetical protein
LFAPQQWFDWAFHLPPGECVITGHVEGQGQREKFNAHIFDDDNYTNWTEMVRQHYDASIQWDEIAGSGLTFVWTPRFTMRGPGHFHFLVQSWAESQRPVYLSIAAMATCFEN